MARPRKTKDSNEPKDWKVGQAAARRARADVAHQVSEALVERDMTGGGEMFVRRVREIMEARATGDRSLFRAAVWEASLAGLAWVVQIDLAGYREEEERARRRASA